LGIVGALREFVGSAVAMGSAAVLLAAFFIGLSRPQKKRRVALLALQGQDVAAGGVDDKADETIQVSALDEFLIKWGFKQDPRIPEECQEDMMTRIKKSGRAGIAAYAITEAGFWLLSVPLAVLAVAVTTGSLPDFNSTEGEAQIAGYSFAFLTFARTIVPARIALALGLAPWVDENVIQKFFPDEISEECELALKDP
jgi:hypothetical protein